jgi:hypothetical protein
MYVCIHVCMSVCMRKYTLTSRQGLRYALQHAMSETESFPGSDTFVCVHV